MPNKTPEADDRLAKLTLASQRVIRRQRTFDYHACAEMARACSTGKEAAERILAELRRVHSAVDAPEDS